MLPVTQSEANNNIHILYLGRLIMICCFPLLVLKGIDFSAGSIDIFSRALELMEGWCLSVAEMRICFFCIPQVFKGIFAQIR